MDVVLWRRLRNIIGKMHHKTGGGLLVNFEDITRCERTTRKLRPSVLRVMLSACFLLSVVLAGYLGTPPFWASEVAAQENCEVVDTFEGQGNLQTPPFEITAEQWQVRYEFTNLDRGVGGFLGIFVYNADNNQIVTHSEPHSYSESHSHSHPHSTWQFDARYWWASYSVGGFGPALWSGRGSDGGEQVVTASWTFVNRAAGQAASPRPRPGEPRRVATRARLRLPRVLRQGPEAISNKCWTRTLPSQRLWLHSRRSTLAGVRVQLQKW